MVHGVSIIWLPVSDIGKAVGFYEGTLGLDRVDVQSEWAQLKTDGLNIGLNARKEEEPGGDGGAILAFSPEGELEAAVEEMKGQGVEFVDGISEHPWGRIANFKDPDGNNLQLYAPPKG